MKVELVNHGGEDKFEIMLDSHTIHVLTVDKAKELATWIQQLCTNGTDYQAQLRAALQHIADITDWTHSQERLYGWDEVHAMANGALVFSSGSDDDNKIID